MRLSAASIAPAAALHGAMGSRWWLQLFEGELAVFNGHVLWHKEQV